MGRKKGDPITGWRTTISLLVGILLTYGTLSGLLIYLGPFSTFGQFNVLAHTLVGTLTLIPLTVYSIGHWQERRGGNLSHLQVTGYVLIAATTACMLSGLWVTWLAIATADVSITWRRIHLATGLALAALLLIHLLTVWWKPLGKATVDAVVAARRRYAIWLVSAAGLMMAVPLLFSPMVNETNLRVAFSDDYNWRFGPQRPFAPSLARLSPPATEAELLQSAFNSLHPADQEKLQARLIELSVQPFGVAERVDLAFQQLGLDLPQGWNDSVARYEKEIKSDGAITAAALANSANCGNSGCHQQIYKEWLPSAHRYSSLDDMFQQVQTIMAEETSPEHTRYCAGCHDPISLFSGAKNSNNITLSAHGADEGTSCLVCHSIVQTDLQGNGDYTVELQSPYLFEHDDGWRGSVGEFLIRSYPDHHINSYSRPLYKTSEFCAACHKQYVDKEVNTDIGKVQGQNQYDSWRNSRWFHGDNDPKTIQCRECHMPLMDSDDPASGDSIDRNRHADDNKHRSHRMLASNQYIPLLHNLEGAVEHAAETDRWLRGDYPIPEIADRWTDGPVVSMELIAPDTAEAGSTFPIQVILTNNKTGHDFPTGPLDMIESWVELHVTDEKGETILHLGGLGEQDEVERAPVWFKADGYDRLGEPIDRHNLWDLVGASYKRSLYPGMTDVAEVQLQCPSMGRGRVKGGVRRDGIDRLDNFSVTGHTGGTLTIKATLWYRKANPEFLKRVYGQPTPIAPLTAMTTARTEVQVTPPTGAQ